MVKGKSNNPVGRPSIRSPKLARKICEQLELGKSLISICKAKGIEYHAILRWIREDGQFSSTYARAREMQADYLADEARALLDEEPRLKTDKFGNTSIDPAWVQLQAKKVDQLKWYASKLKPKVYGKSVRVLGDKSTPLYSFSDALEAARKDRTV